MSLDPILLTRRWPERRPVVLATAATAFVAILVATAIADDPAAAIAVLYLLPVILVALEAGMVGGLITVADVVASAARLGVITVVHDAPLEPEDRVALELLGLQAGLAADNQRLPLQEREAATLEAELRRGRDDLLEQRSGFGRLLDTQEDDRRRVAGTLHEELAQTLAAVLVGLRMLRRQAGDDRRAALDELHGVPPGRRESLAAARARAGVLGGSLRAEPKPGGRTRIRAEVPLGRESTAARRTTDPLRG